MWHYRRKQVTKLIIYLFCGHWPCCDDWGSRGTCLRMVYGLRAERGWGGAQNPNLKIGYSVSFQHAKPPSWTSSELLIPPGRLPEGLWRGSSSKSGSNSRGFLLIHWETPAGYLIPYISLPSQSSGTSSPPCISSDLTLAEETLIITQMQTICAANI